MRRHLFRDPASAHGGHGRRLPRLGIMLMVLVALVVPTGAVFAQPGTGTLQNQQTSCVFFQQTGHSVCNGFLRYWQTYGGLAVFGYPVSDEYVDNNMTMQFFERARFEWHPGSDPARWDVQLGRLGAEGVGSDFSTTLNLLRANVAAFKNPDIAKSAGWHLVSGLDNCFDNPGVGGMGIHYINTDMLDTSVDPLTPEAMVYQPDANGNLTLGAVEWIVPADKWDAEAHGGLLPEVLGHSFHLNQALGVYILHAWIFNDNPAGMFNDWNPNVSCPS